MRAVLLAVAVVSVTGCFHPDIEDGSIECGPGPGNVCPPGYRCGYDGRCWIDPKDAPVGFADGTPADTMVIDGPMTTFDAPQGTIDAPSGTVDAPPGTIDAPQGTTDARRADAFRPPIDARPADARPMDGGGTGIPDAHIDSGPGRRDGGTVTACGNKTCEPSLGESCSNCTVDCGRCEYCGDCDCDPADPRRPENSTTCPKDCKAGPSCGDGVCNGTTELCIGPSGCPSDCCNPRDPVCGDGVCALGIEDPCACPTDCSGLCCFDSPDGCIPQVGGVCSGP